MGNRRTPTQIATDTIEELLLDDYYDIHERVARKKLIEAVATLTRMIEVANHRGRLEESKWYDTQRMNDPLVKDVIYGGVVDDRINDLHRSYLLGLRR